MKLKMNSMKKKLWSGLPALLFALLAVPSICSAQVAVNFGTVENGTVFVDLLPNTANQTVQFFASGIAGVGVNGLELDLQIGDGGAALGGTDTAPTIGVIDLLSGSIFNSSPTQADVVVTPLAAQSTVDQAAGVDSNGLIATVEFDTTGVDTGTVQLLLNNVAENFSTSFFVDADVIDADIPDAIIRIGNNVVPEPTSMVLVAGFGLAGLVQRRRRQIA